MHNMHIKELDLNLLVVMDAMLRDQNVSKAAERVGLTQSAMSHALNRLRLYFDDPLFVKSGQVMEPTPKAIGLQEAVVDVMGTVRQRILSESYFEPSNAKREFVICVSDMGELVFAPTILKLIRKLAPHCRLRSMRVPAEQIEGLLAKGEADLAIGTYRSAPEGLYKQRLFMHGFATLVHAKSKIKRKISLTDFERLPHIAVTLSGRSAIPFDSILEEKGIKRNVVMKTPHFLSVPFLIEQQSDLIATIPVELANVFSRHGLVRSVEPPLELPSYAISQHWHPLFHHDPALIWLRDLIKRTFETYPDLRES